MSRLTDAAAAPRVPRRPRRRPGRDRADLTARRRLELLARVAELLDTPPDLDGTLEQVAALAVAGLADWCAVDLEPDPGAGGRPRLVATTHRNPAMIALARQMQARWPAPEHDPVRERMLRDLRPVHLPGVSDEMLVAAAQDAEHLAALRSLGMSSAVCVPLQAGGRGFGALLLVTTHGRRLGREDVDLALELGRRAGAAVERARLVERQAAQARDLALSEARYRLLVEAGSLGVFRAGADGTVLGDIPAWHRITGRAAGGWDWLDAVHPDDREPTRGLWCAAVTSGAPYDATYRVTTPDDGPRWFRARAVPLRTDPDDPSTPILEWVGTVDDVTDAVLARRAGEAVRASAEALARALGVGEVIHALHHVAAAALGAHASAVALATPTGTVVDQHGYDRVPPTMVEVEHPEESWPGLERVLATGTPLFLTGPDDLRALADGSRALEVQVPAALAEGEVSWALLPLRYDRGLLGAVRFGWTEPHTFPAAERDTLQAIAAQHAAALVRARLYDAERETSLTLQAALAPRVPSRVNGLEVAMHYEPAGTDVQVGGDWVDALALGDGRVCLVVGDVMGSGIPAAATMGRLRTALTALALHEDDPARLLLDLDAMLASGDLLATVGLAVVDPAARVMDVYSAGHLPLLLASPDGTARLVPAPQVPPVGVGWSAGGRPPSPARVRLPAGAVVALCTDGLVETRHEAIDVRLEAWRTLVEARLPMGDLDAAAEALVAAMDVPADDDVTLLLARLPRPEDGAG